MIEKKRLEELIEQGATIWHDDYGEIKLDKNTCEICDVKTFTDKHMYWCLSFMYVYEGVNHTTEVNIADLEEDVETAKWHYEMDCSKTEKLIFPTWKQIENTIEKMKKFGLVHNDKVFARIITKDSIYYFKLCKDLDTFTFSLKQTYIGDDLCEQISNKFPTFLGIATKENYTLACRKAKELFLGEKKNGKN